jgi:hypothetical protein
MEQANSIPAKKERCSSFSHFIYKEFKPLNGTRQQHTSKKRKMPWLGISVLATIQKNDELIMDDVTRSLQKRPENMRCSN